MKVAQGGTTIFCPSCKGDRVCKAIPVPEITFDPSDYGQRQYMVGHDDIQMFRRGRRCLACGHEFVTAEVDEEFLNELVELRGALKEIKENAEKYISQSSAAATSLKKLSKSLSVLRALKMYQQE